MPIAETDSGLIVSWGMAHHRQGVLISRQVSVQPPAPIDCVRFSCLWRYAVKSWAYTLLLLYHQYRTRYAEAYPDKNMPGEYRTGEPSPEGIWATIWAIMKVRARR